MITFRNALLAGAVVLAIGACAQPPAPPAAQVEAAGAPPARDYAAEIVSADGAIGVPADFDRWPTLGSWATASAGEGAPVDEWHQVYVSPGGIESYLANGKFADGTVLVKDVRGFAAATLNTGHAHYPTEVAVRFVMVKDSTNARADHPLWGDGWGWALYNGTDTTTQAAPSYEEGCQACHVPATSTDYIFAEAYPVLRNGGPAATPSWANPAQ